MNDPDDSYPQQKVALTAAQDESHRPILDFFRMKNVTDDILSRLYLPRDLQELNLYGTGISDAGLRFIGHLERLEFLDLSQTGVTDKGLEYLSRLISLRDLRLKATHVKGDGLASLGKMRDLSRLDLSFTLVTDLLFLHNFPPLERLQDLGLACRGITTGVIPVLKLLPKLKRLSLHPDHSSEAEMQLFRAELPSCWVGVQLL